ncbi:MAG TPA: hypothetical protein VI756_19730, partial [Blastocatellia bacterium]
RRFGAVGALNYLVGEKLVTYAKEAEQNPKFAAELPRFLAAIWQTFNPYELAGYVASVKGIGDRRLLRKLLFVR